MIPRFGRQFTCAAASVGVYQPSFGMLPVLFPAPLSLQSINHRVIEQTSFGNAISAIFI
jgi:hypothetical protein